MLDPFAQAQRQWEEPEDGHDWLEGKPHGACPWDDLWLLEPTLTPFCECENWDPDQSEDDNRARYAREKQAAADHEAMVFRGATREQREEF